MIIYKVSFQGKEYWRIGDALAPLEHCDEEGNLFDPLVKK